MANRPAAATLVSRGSRVVVTGGAGFVGHHLVRALEERGDEVLVIDDLSHEISGSLSENTRLEHLDITRDDLRSPFSTWRPSTVYHLAAQVSVPRSMEDPARDLEVNVIGTMRVIDAARAAGVSRMIFTSSGGAVYGETDSPATEATPPAPRSYYGAHKLLAEQHVGWSGIAHAIARPSNVYGPGQPPDGEGAVIAAFVAAALDGSSLVIHGDGTQRRDFLHVSDLVAALVLLGSHDESGTWNISADVTTSVIELAGQVRRIAGLPLAINHRDRRVGDVTDSSLASERIRQLGWSPLTSLAVGLAQLLGIDAVSA